jgi:hypothetical protein
MINDFRARLNITQDVTHQLAIYSGMWEFFKHKSHNKTYISNEQLHTIEFCMSPGIKVHIEG